MIFSLVVTIGTAAIVSAGVYLTLRAFRASDARGNGDAQSGQDPAATAHHHISRHDAATDERLRHFFDGQTCALCKRTIPPVPRSGLKPGLFNPTTHDTHAWDEIPNENLSSTLEGQLALCASCVVAESFRRRFADRVVDRMTAQHDAHAADRISANAL